MTVNENCLPPFFIASPFISNFEHVQSIGMWSALIYLFIAYQKKFEICDSLVYYYTTLCRVYNQRIFEKKFLAQETKTRSNNIETKRVAPQLILNNFHKLF